MQLAILVVIVVTYLGRDAAGWTPWALDGSPWVSIGLSLACLGVPVCILWIRMRVLLGRLRRQGHWRAILLADRLLRVHALGVVFVHVCNIVFLDWMGAVGEVVGDLWIIDEVIGMTPPLLAWMAGWLAFAPIDRHIRERAMIGQLDAGLPVYPIPTRWGYTWRQCQFQLGLVLAPSLLILGWVEGVESFVNLESTTGLPGWVGDALMVVGVGLIFLLAPFMLRLIWPTRSLGEGDLRDRLMALTLRHRVRLRDILIWETHGSLINGAIIGVFGRVRYVLLSDALLDSMTTREIEAVMAHEVGHAKRHHLPWLALSLIACFTVASVVMDLAGVDAGVSTMESNEIGFELAGSGGEDVWSVPWAIIGTFGSGLLGFGWISRRFERQADTFAVVHLSGSATVGDAGDEADAPGVLTEAACHAMSSALQRVADLNHIDRKRKSWRHGSIAWRQGYLERLVGQDPRGLGIDRVIVGIKIGAMIGIGIGAAWTMGIGGFGG